MNAIEYTPKFELGRTVATPAALELFTEDEIFTMFQRHHSGWVRMSNQTPRPEDTSEGEVRAANRGGRLQRSWGDTCEEDAKTNEEAIKYGNRILSVYKHDNGRTCWIITECDRSATTVLLPDEY